ncbi:hypothetical protein QN239_25015 [Mycolicibacterium sp. Y3]
MRAPVEVPRLRDYASMLARVWLIILVATLLSAGAAVAAVKTRPASYTASVEVFATVAGDPSTFALYYGGMGAKLRIPSYVELAKSTLVAQRAVQELQSTTPPEELASRVSAEWVPGGADARGRANSVFMRVTVTNSNPETAVKEANAIGSNLVTLSKELEWFESKFNDDIQYKGPLAELLPVGVAKTAQLVPTPILGPMAIGAGVGLAVSVLIMLAVEIGRGTVGTRGQLNYIVKLATHRKT